MKNCHFQQVRAVESNRTVSGVVIGSVRPVSRRRALATEKMAATSSSPPRKDERLLTEESLAALHHDFLELPDFERDGKTLSRITLLSKPRKVRMPTRRHAVLYLNEDYLPPVKPPPPPSESLLGHTISARRSSLPRPAPRRSLQRLRLEAWAAARGEQFARERPTDGRRHARVAHAEEPEDAQELVALGAQSALAEQVCGQGVDGVGWSADLAKGPAEPRGLASQAALDAGPSRRRGPDCRQDQREPAEGL